MHGGSIMSTSTHTSPTTQAASCKSNSSSGLQDAVYGVFAGAGYQAPHGSHPSVSQPPNQAAQGNYPQQYPQSHSMSHPYSTPDARPSPAYNMSMPGTSYPSQASGANTQGPRPLANQAHAVGPYQSGPGMQGARPDMPFGAGPAGPYAAPYAGQHANQRNQQQSGNTMQQQHGGHGLNPHGGPAAQSQLGPVHGPHRPLEMSQDRARGNMQGGPGHVPEQNGRNRPNHNSMSASDVQAQQAERKRRFTEQKAGAQWKQVLKLWLAYVCCLVGGAASPMCSASC